MKKEDIKNWLKENWFKVSILTLLIWIAFILQNMNIKTTISGDLDIGQKGTSVLE